MTGKKPKSPVIVRKYTDSDYDAVTALWDACGLPYKPRGRDTRQKIGVEVTKETAAFLVAVIENRIIGSVLATHDGRKGWINRLAVAPEFQHQGIAQLLLHEAENTLYDLGMEIIACLIEDYNDPSMAFVSKAGYQHHPNIYYYSKRKYPDV